VSKGEGKTLLNQRCLLEINLSREKGAVPPRAKNGSPTIDEKKIGEEHLLIERKANLFLASDLLKGDQPSLGIGFLV